MTHEGSQKAVNARSIESDFTNTLFPLKFNLKISNREGLRLDNESVGGYDEYPEDDTSSIRNLRDIFTHNTNTKIDKQVEYDLADWNLIQRDNTINCLETSVSESYLLESVIIDQIAEKTEEIDKVDGRLKYLKLYEKFKTIPNSTSGLQDENASLFCFSEMSDFDRYMKQTELNEAIYNKVVEKMNTSGNFLTVVESKDLNNFYSEDDFREEKVNKLSKIKRLYRKENPPPPPPHENIELDDLYYTSTGSTESVKHRKYLARKLKIRHLQMISFGGTLGVGLFLNVGKAFTIAGGFGTLLSFIICGLIVLATIVSFCEMVTFVSVVDGVSGLSSRFVDDSFGFAIGWLYFLSFALGLSGEIVASVIMLTYYPNLNILSNRGSSAGFVTLFLFLIVLSNMLDIRVYGEIEYITSLIKLVMVAVVIIIMIISNRGGFSSESGVIGFRYWDHLKSDFENNIIFGLFRPSFNLNDTGMSPPSEGIQGNKGRFMSLLVAILVTAYSYSGTEIVCIAACEAKNPRKALPSATRRVFWRIIFFYCVSVFVVSLNIYSGDPRLLRYLLGSTGVSSNEFYLNAAIKFVGGENCVATGTEVIAGYGTGAQSPWIVALQSVSLCKFSSVLNGIFVFFAVTCGNSQLYVSSRTIYSLSLQKKAPKCLSYTTRLGIPYVAVLFSASFGVLSYICVSKSATVVFQNLTSVIASSGIMVWFAMCLSFIRFYYGMKKRPDIISRDDKDYPYKSPFQPYSAIFGLVGTTIIILAMGFTVFLHDEWDTMSFFSSYGTLIAFAVLFCGHKLIKHTHASSLETLDFDTGRREMDRYIWDGGREYNPKSLKETIHNWLSFLA